MTWVGSRGVGEMCCRAGKWLQDNVWSACGPGCCETLGVYASRGFDEALGEG